MTQLFSNPRKTRSVRPLGAVDIEPVREAILAIPEEIWSGVSTSKPNPYQALGKTQHLMFRFVSSPKDWSQSYDLPTWADWRERIEPLMAQATAEYGYARGAFPRIMLARMPAGGVIHPHVDENRSAAWPHKIHVPIKTNPQVEFYVDPDVHHLQAGQAYEVNNRGVHAVRNLGAESRIHLIFEYYDQDQPVEGI
jgi:hypothetical protein